MATGNFPESNEESKKGRESEEEVIENYSGIKRETNDEMQIKYDELKIKYDELKIKYDELKRENHEQKIELDMSEKEIKSLKKKLQHRRPDQEGFEAPGELKKPIQERAFSQEEKEQEERLVGKHFQEENERLKQIIKNAQLEGKVCNESCILDVINWICKEKLPLVPFKCSCNNVNNSYCRRKLEKILIYHAYEKISPQNLDCNSLMGILEKIGIVKKEREYLFPQEKSSKDSKREINIDKAWKEIIGNKNGKIEHVLILGRKKFEYGQVLGHAVVCDLDAMPKQADKVVTHDPQQVLKTTVDGESFITYVEGDIALMLFTVNLKKLEEILIKSYKREDDSKTSQPHTSGARIEELPDTLDTQLRVTKTERFQDDL